MRPSLPSLALSAFVLLLAACQHKPGSQPNRPRLSTFTSGMVSYLSARGDLCLAKNDFPIDVSEREFQIGSRNALQLPVLEKKGLLTSSEAVALTKTEDGDIPTKVRRYQLTDEGRRYYLAREAPGLSNSAGQKAYQSDLCAAKLSLDHVISFELSAPSQATSATVTYTYQVVAAPWTADPKVQQVFPAVTRVVAGAGTAQLKEAFTLTEAGWIANDLLQPSAQAVAKNATRTP